MVTAAILAIAAWGTLDGVELRVVMTPQSGPHGSMIEASLVAKNVSKRPIAITRAVWDGGLCAHAWIEVYRDGEKVAVTGGESSSPLVQVMSDNQVTKHRFTLLMPGFSTNVYWIKFDKLIPSSTPRPDGKDGYVAWLKSAKPLSEGAYEVKGFYEFKKPAARTLPGEEEYEFTPSALDLYQRVFIGKVEGRGEFTITK